MLRLGFCTSVVVTLAVCAHGGSLSVVVFDNFGPDNSYETDRGWTIGSGWGKGEHNGNAFRPSATGPLSHIEAAIGWVSNEGVPVQLTLYTVDQEGLPDQVLEIWQEPIWVRFGTPRRPVRFDSALHPSLEKGTEYALIASAPGAPDDWLAWSFNSTNDMGGKIGRRDVGPWFRADTIRGAMRVWIPEPASHVLLALALVVLTSRRADRPGIVGRGRRTTGLVRGDRQ